MAARSAEFHRLARNLRALTGPLALADRMEQKLLSALLLSTGVIVALGSVGHSFIAVVPVEQALSGQAMPAAVGRSILAVWHFAGACMAVFGALVIWQWRKIHRGARGQVFVPLLVGLFYSVFGVYAVVRFGAPFFAVFALLGGCLLVCARFFAGFQSESDAAAAPRG